MSDALFRGFLLAALIGSILTICWLVKALDRAKRRERALWEALIDARLTRYGLARPLGVNLAGLDPREALAAIEEALGRPIKESDAKALRRQTLPSVNPRVIRRNN